MKTYLKSVNWNKTGKVALSCAVVLCAVAADVALAAPAGGGGGDTKGIAKIATNIMGSFQAIGQLMIAIAYVSGIGFAIASIFKFKQHKDNPTQIPLGTPIALLAIAIALVFLPAFFKPLGETLTGKKNAAAGGFTGAGVEQIPGGEGS